MRGLAFFAFAVGLGASPASRVGSAQLGLPSCTEHLRAAHGSTSLPPTCRTLGPLRLGAAFSAARALLGPPDAETIKEGGSHVYAWIFPRALNRDLAAQPVAASGLVYGVLYVAERGGSIVAVRDDTPGLAPTFDFAGVKVGNQVAVADRTLGPPTSISRAQDFRGYFPLPLTVHVDEQTQSIQGFEIGERAQDLQSPTAIGLPVNTTGGLVRHLGLKFEAP